MSRVRLFVRLVLTLALAASTQGLLFVQGAFLAKQDWIVETLCVNRDRPEMKCDGHCVLKDRMEAHHHDEDGPSDEAVVQLALSITPLVTEAVTLPGLDGVEVCPGGPGPLVGAAAGASADVFRPPRGV